MMMNEQEELYIEMDKEDEEEALAAIAAQKEAVKTTNSEDMIDVLKGYLAQTDLLVEGLNLASQLGEGCAILLAGLVRVRQGVDLAAYWIETHSGNSKKHEPEDSKSDEEL